ncbi:MAG TPA: peptide deformylase [Blastocatellia bacterium]|nr:peptide deformylase [Blastocatellia bacterium]
MIRPIVKYGDTVLAKSAEEVNEFGPELTRLVEDMFETMYAAPGVGLAAPQIGISKRVFVMDCAARKEDARKYAVINPVIQLREGEQEGGEGCLSVPGFSFDIKRAKHVIVSGLDVKGDPIRLDVTDLEARCVSHEVDHLDGKLLLSRVSPLKRDMTIRKIKKKIRDGEW